MINSGINLASYATLMNQKGTDINTLGMFASVGLTMSDRTPKPALAVWDSFRSAP